MTMQKPKETPEQIARKVEMQQKTEKPQESETGPTKIYLACPYWHDEEAVRDERLRLVTIKAGELMLEGYNVFSPLTHSCPIAEALDPDEHFPDGDYGHDFWLNQDESFIEWCDELWVLRLEGWLQSDGVRWEQDKAHEIGKKVRLIDFNKGDEGKPQERRTLSQCVDCCNVERYRNVGFCRECIRNSFDKYISPSPELSEKGMSCQIHNEAQSAARQAEQIINGERQDAYGAPEDSFGIIANLWTAYLKQLGLGMAISKIDVAHMMALFKIARMQGQKPHRDNYIDAIGYLQIAADRLLGGSDGKEDDKQSRSSG